MTVTVAGDDDIDITASGSAEDNEFDRIVEQMEDVIMSEEFQRIQNDFSDRHCGKIQPFTLQIYLFVDCFRRVQ